MSAQRSVKAASGRFVRPGLVLVTGALALTLAACGGGNSPTPAAAAPTTQTSRAPGGPGNPPPGTFGTAAAVSASSVEVQNPQNGQVTVNFNASTTFTNTVSATLADVTVGSCVSVTSATGGARATNLTARAVMITTAGANGCTAGGFGGGGGFVGGGGASRTPNPSRQPRPSGAPGAPGNFGRAFGSVTALSANGFTVHGMARGSNPAIDTTVTVNSTTTYTKSASATSSALAVGECIAALGPADDTGAVTARTIVISKAGPNGCVAGFRRGGGGGNG